MKYIFWFPCVIYPISSTLTFPRFLSTPFSCRDVPHLIKYVASFSGKHHSCVMGWTVRGSNAVGARFSAPVGTVPGINRASYTLVAGSFRGVNRPGRGVNHPPPTSAGVKERTGLYFYALSLPSWQFIGWTLNQHSSAVRAARHCGASCGRADAKWWTN
jgi:hypothetical protein